MASHHTRVLLIGALFGVALLGQIVLMALGRFGETESAVLGGVTAVLLPALVDATAVERRRRDPNSTAIIDDVLPSGGPKVPSIPPS